MSDLLQFYFRIFLILSVVLFSHGQYQLQHNRALLTFGHSPIIQIPSSLNFAFKEKKSHASFSYQNVFGLRNLSIYNLGLYLAPFGLEIKHFGFSLFRDNEVSFWSPIKIQEKFYLGTLIKFRSVHIPSLDYEINFNSGISFLFRDQVQQIHFVFENFTTTRWYQPILKAEYRYTASPFTFQINYTKKERMESQYSILSALSLYSLLTLQLGYNITDKQETISIIFIPSDFCLEYGFFHQKKLGNSHIIWLAIFF